MLMRATVCLGAAAIAASLAGEARAGAKVPKNQAGYQDTPRGGARCDRCTQYQPPTSCKIVEGAVSPSGACNFFAPKSG
jgi:hypothetical protein